MENTFHENTFKDYYYKTLSDDSNDNLMIVRDSSKTKPKRGEEDRLDDLIKFTANIKKKQCSSVSGAQANGGIAFISTNREDAALTSHLIKIEVYDMKKLANVPQEQHWKNANIRLKYFTNNTNQYMECINKMIYSITKEITQTDNSKKYVSIITTNDMNV